MSTEPESAPATEATTEAETTAAETPHTEPVPPATDPGRAEADSIETEASSEGESASAGDEATAEAAAEAAVGGGAGDGSVADSASDAGATTDDGGAGEGGGAAGAAPQVSEAEAELAAQRAFRARIEERKKARQDAVDSGGKLSGKAADLLAAVRAVEGGGRPEASVFDEPEPEPRKIAPTPRPTPPTTPAAAPVPSPDAIRATAEVLTEGGAPATLATGAASALGTGAADVLRADPWQLLRVAGVRPEQADGFARALLGPECGPGDDRRGRALAGWLLEQAALAGHTALEASALGAALGRYAVPEPEEAVQSAVAEGELLVFQDAVPGRDGGPVPTPVPAPEASAPPADGEGDEAEPPAQPVQILLGLEQYALAEESLADGLARLVNSAPKDGSTVPARWNAAAERASGSTAELLRAVAGHPLVLHTGGEAARAEPAAVVAAAAELGLRVCAATHTGDGRRRIAAQLPGTVSEGTAVTVAGLLSGTEGPGRDSEGALAVDLLVVLDAPQLDVETAAALVESLPDGARLLLSGDPSVLWSAGPGRVFADLLAARVCPEVASRLPDPGPVGELVSGIGIGELNEVAAPGREVVIVPVRDAGEAVHRTVQLVADSVPRAFGVPPEETVVITPGHGGAAGTRVLNTALKERLNPGPGRFGGFDPGDRVVHTPSPGRAVPGRVVRADAAGLHLECDGEEVVVAQDRVEQSVRHGWAVTAHQAVGRRTAAAVVVLPGDAAKALNRAWVYTAFSRGERHLSVVHGAEGALPHAVAELPAKPRTTRLPTLLRTQLPTRP
ncbi:helix-hairpin-helix domain-containing protein [Streptomyces sp. NPDC058045]|uniref:helix-hairpin-helix domain-containing protein n=1 Tax=Streptomyces sp. NPDC058045 TaxID=3346311 RepID=UPI0036E396E0